MKHEEIASEWTGCQFIAGLTLPLLESLRYSFIHLGGERHWTRKEKYHDDWATSPTRSTIRFEARWLDNYTKTSWEIVELRGGRLVTRAEFKVFAVLNIKARLGKKTVTVAGFGLKNHVFAWCTVLAIVSRSLWLPRMIYSNSFCHVNGSTLRL